METRSAMRLVVVEAGAALPPAALAGAAEEIVVMQRDGDQLGEVMLAAIRQITRAEERGGHIRQAVIAVSDKNGEQALACRTLLARALVAHQVRAGDGEVLLCAARNVGLSERHELLALAATLMTEIAGTHVWLRVLFGSESGRLRRASPVEAETTLLHSGIQPLLAEPEAETA